MKTPLRHFGVKKNLKRNGFTLIELLVVITILGVLVGIMTPDFREYNQRTNLSNTVKLTQSVLFDAFSLARSRTQHFVVIGKKSDSFLEIHTCTDLACATHSITQDPNNASRGKHLSFLGKNTLLDKDIKVQFLAPHGDILFPDEGSSVEEITLKIGDTIQYKEIKVYKKSGLIELQ